MFFLSMVSVVTLLLSLTAAIPTPDECVHLNKTLSAEDLHMIYGKWILHEAYVWSSHEVLRQILKTTNSSQIELIPSDNNHIVTFNYANMRHETCTRYSVNFTIVGNTIQHSSTTNSTYEAQFLKTCEDCLLILYSTVKSDGNKVTYLLFYKKAGTLPQTEKETAKEQAWCQGFVHPPDFIYTQAELCPEKNDASKTKEPEQ